MLNISNSTRRTKKVGVVEFDVVASKELKCKRTNRRSGPNDLLATAHRTPHTTAHVTALARSISFGFDPL